MPNPFDVDAIETRWLKLAQSRARLEVEALYLKDVLWTHVKIGLAFEASKDGPRAHASPETAWIVSFGQPGDGQINMALATALPN